MHTHTTALFCLFVGLTCHPCVCLFIFIFPPARMTCVGHCKKMQISCLYFDIQSGKTNIFHVGKTCCHVSLWSGALPSDFEMSPYHFVFLQLFWTISRGHLHNVPFVFCGVTVLIHSCSAPMSSFVTPAPPFLFFK